MNNIYDTLRTVGVIIIVLLFSGNIKGQENVTNDWKVTTVGQVRQLIPNRARIVCGHRCGGNERAFGFPGLVGCEYPPGSGEEHLQDVGIWIGGITPTGDTLVSVGAGHRSADEFWPSEAPWDSVWVIDKGKNVDIGGTLPDGSEDFYWNNYSAVSDQDYVCRFNDYGVLDPNRPTSGGSNGEPHEPLYIDVIQTVYSWGFPPLDEVLIWTYRIIPTRHDIDEIFFTLNFEAKVGQVLQNPIVDDRGLYFPDRHMVAAEDKPGGQDGNAYGAIGFKFLFPTGIDPDDLTWTYRWGHANIGEPIDADRYRITMSSGEVMEQQQLYTGQEAWISFGPFDLSTNDTLKIQMAELLGKGVDGVLEKSTLMDQLQAQQFRLPRPPPVPRVKLQPMNKGMKITWKPTEDHNPEEYKDPGRSDEVSQPFEGYRLYKSTEGKDGPWTMLAEYDISGNSYGKNIGLKYNYTDKGLLNNVKYYYAVTAFSKRDSVLPWPSQESSIFQGVEVGVPGPTTPETVGEVAVVPNPYRGDQDYTEYNPPWEKSPTGRPWMEQDRKIQFINLPAACEIQIYSASGDFIKSIPHHNPELGYENWNLTSHVNQAIASGVYLYTVENLTTGEVQVGKFVIIK